MSLFQVEGLVKRFGGITGQPVGITAIFLQPLVLPV